MDRPKLDFDLERVLCRSLIDRERGGRVGLVAESVDGHGLKDELGVCFQPPMSLRTILLARFPRVVINRLPVQPLRSFATSPSTSITLLSFFFYFVFCFLFLSFPSDSSDCFFFGSIPPWRMDGS